VNLRRAGENFLMLKQRGLHGVDLIVSDQHKGLVRAISQYFQVRHGRDVRHILCEIFLIRHRSSYRKRFMVR